jgi:drug/metabolite transporter (DMT)-like permease
MLLYLEPVVSVTGAAVFLGERVTWVMTAGGALILAGVAVASSRRPADNVRDTVPDPPGEDAREGERTGG